MARRASGIPIITAKIAKAAPMIIGGLQVVESLVVEPVLCIEIPVVLWVADILFLVWESPGR
jgi:hypothetical protein